MKAATFPPEDFLKKRFRLVCVFPEEAPDEEQVKSDIKKLLSAELRRQMHRRAEEHTS